MTDSIRILPPGFRLTDSSTGAPLSGAVIRFYDAGTSTPKTMYSDKELTTSLGTSVTTDSLGYPTSDGTTKTLIYTGTAAYKITIETSSAVEIASHDNVPGALDTSGFGGDESVTATFPVVTKSLDYTVLDADQNTIFVGNCSGGTVTLTLPSAATVGDGWQIRVQHAGSANRVLLATVSSQTISEGSLSFVDQFPLILNGEELTLTSNGGNWRISDHTAPFLKVSPIPVTDRITSAPSASAGAIYIVATAFSTFSQHDVLLDTGNDLIAFTPPEDCGWLAYVADEDEFYRFKGTAWVASMVDDATSSAAGKVLVSTQAAMETGTATDTAVLIGHQHYHPGHPKFWVKASVSAGTPSVAASYNVTSITDTATGKLTVTIATDFSSANWCATGQALANSGGDPRSVYMGNASQTATAIEIDGRDGGGSLDDPSAWFVSGMGDQ